MHTDPRPIQDGRLRDYGWWPLAVPVPFTLLLSEPRLIKLLAVAHIDETLLALAKNRHADTRKINANRSEYSDTSCPLSCFQSRICRDCSAFTPIPSRYRKIQICLYRQLYSMVQCFFMSVRVSSFRFSYWWYFTI